MSTSRRWTELIEPFWAQQSLRHPCSSPRLHRGHSMYTGLLLPFSFLPQLCDWQQFRDVVTNQSVSLALNNAVLSLFRFIIRSVAFVLSQTSLSSIYTNINISNSIKYVFLNVFTIYCICCCFSQNWLPYKPEWRDQCFVWKVVFAIV